MHIGINAHLLSSKKGYRSAGIHGYIYNVLAHLHQAAPQDFTFTAMVGKGNPHSFDGITMRQAGLDTESPLKRVLWEQTIQPIGLSAFDLYHALAFVSPVLLNKPSVVTVYDLSFIHFPEVLTTARRLYLRMFTALSCRRAARVIAISHSTAQDVHESFGIPLGKIDIAPPGYDQAVFHPLPAEEVAVFRQKNGLPERFWLFLGTLEPRKNLVTLLDAYAALPESERLPLFLAGDKGWLYDDIFARVQEHQLQGQVFFPGFIPAEDLPLWYNSAEVFILPSVYEGFGIPVLEAMACGTPVIISQASSLPEVAGKSGIHVPPRDRAAWTDALHHAYLDAHWRAEHSHIGLLEARHYTWHNTAHQTVASYQHALPANLTQ